MRKYGKQLTARIDVRIDAEMMTEIESFEDGKGDFVRKALKHYIRHRQEIEREKGRAINGST